MKLGTIRYGRYPEEYFSCDWCCRSEIFNLWNKPDEDLLEVYYEEDYPTHPIRQWCNPTCLRKWIKSQEEK